MRRDHRDWADRLSDYLSGGLEASERDGLEAHLGECGDCREVLAGLRAIVAEAGALADLEPARDLWPGIASAIDGPVPAVARLGDRSVIELPSAREVSPRRRGSTFGRRLRLAAAAAGLMAVSAGTAWWLASGQGTAGPGLASSGTPLDGAVTPASTGSPPADLASELATLEEVLAVARESLDPNTVRVLERNLAVIELAISDSQRALAVDPGNEFLTEHLERMYRRKLVYLQDVVRVVQWES